jgi:hypothetical protein
MEHIDTIGVPDRREAVTDEEHRAASEEVTDPDEQVMLGPGIERRGRFIEDDERRISVEGSCKGHPLPLPDRQIDAAQELRSEQSLVCLRQFRDELVGAGLLGGALDGDRCRWLVVDVTEADVLLGYFRCMRMKSWKMTATLWLSSVWSIDAMSMSSQVTVPDCGRYRPANTFASVDLPDPFSPTRATTSPARMVADTSMSAGDSPLG